jgi:hypothetical protein
MKLAHTWWWWDRDVPRVPPAPVPVVPPRLRLLPPGPSSVRPWPGSISSPSAVVPAVVQGRGRGRQERKGFRVLGYLNLKGFRFFG